VLEILCVALAVYFESRGEPIEGQYAVASVVWNRRNDPRWPNHTCEVVAEKGQFESWPLIKAQMPLSIYPEYLGIPHNPAMRKALAAASFTAEEPTTRALFFAQAGYLKFEYLETIGNHEFYIPHED